MKLWLLNVLCKTWELSLGVMEIEILNIHCLFTLQSSPAGGNQTKQNPGIIFSVSKGGDKKAGEGHSQGHGVKDKGEWP